MFKFTDVTYASHVYRKNRRKIPTRRGKNLKSELKSKSRRRRNVVEKSQSESKTLDANYDEH